MTLIDDGTLPAEVGASATEQFLRFCAVGVVGFIVDAGVLQSVLSTGLLDPLGGRMLSFGCAVLTTFTLNRRWSFKGAVVTSVWPTLATYLGVQGAGFFCNFTVYGTIYVLAPPPINKPLYCLMLASAVSMTINFVGARALVFRSQLRGWRSSRPEDISECPGSIK